MAASSPATTVEVDGYEVRVTNPDRVYFADLGLTKIDLVDYYLSIPPLAADHSSRGGRACACATGSA